MSNPSLPEELLDHIVDFLHGQKEALKSSCLVSKSWIQRARKHLFAFVYIDSATLQLWKNTFPGPSGTPAFYTKYLFINRLQDVAAADGEEGGWIQTFSRVVRFRMHINGSLISLAPFYGFSPILETLHIDFTPFPSSRIFNLIISFPLLKNVTVSTYGGSFDRTGIFDDRHLVPIQPCPLNPPAFTGHLELTIRTGIDPIASRLLSLPSCLHFRGLKLVLHKGTDVSLITALVESCCATLESLYLKCTPMGTHAWHPSPRRYTNLWL